MRKEGVEPSRPRHSFLRATCLPVPPLPQMGLAGLEPAASSLGNLRSHPSELQAQLTAERERVELSRDLRPRGFQDRLPCQWRPLRFSGGSRTRTCTGLRPSGLADQRFTVLPCLQIFWRRARESNSHRRYPGSFRDCCTTLMRALRA